MIATGDLEGPGLIITSLPPSCKLDALSLELVGLVFAPRDDRRAHATGLLPMQTEFDRLIQAQPELGVDCCMEERFQVVNSTEQDDNVRRPRGRSLWAARRQCSRRSKIGTCGAAGNDDEGTGAKSHLERRHQRGKRPTTLGDDLLQSRFRSKGVIYRCEALAGFHDTARGKKRVSPPELLPISPMNEDVQRNGSRRPHDPCYCINGWSVSHDLNSMSALDFCAARSIRRDARSVVCDFG